MVTAVAYLSRIWINPLRAAAQRMIQNPQVTHAAVLGGLSRQPVTERVLWRLEPDSPHRMSILVLTRSVPSWEHIIEAAGWPAADEPQALTRPYQPLLDQIAVGREYAFRLRANPVSALRHPERPSAEQARKLQAQRPRGVRMAHRTAAQQQAWLLDRISGWGFEIPVAVESGNPELRLIGRDRVEFTKSGPGGRNHVVLVTATFEGRLRVLDSGRAKASILDGVGAARAYGCGMITLAPLSRVGRTMSEMA
jgi:CRISPR system Cascade subunit CasE